VGILLGLSIRFWMEIPGVNYLLELFFAAAIILSVIEGRLVPLTAAAVCGLILGAIPGLAVNDFAYFLLNWSRIFIPPLLLGVLINRGWRAGLFFAVSAAVLAIILFALFDRIGGILYLVIDQAENTVLGLMSTTMSTLGYNQESAQSSLDGIMMMFRIFKRLLPGFYTLAGLGEFIVSFFLVELYYVRRDSYFPGFGPFIYWKISDKVLYFLGTTLVVRLIADGYIRMLADNVLLVLSVFYAVCGLALIEHLLRRLHLPMAVRLLFYVGLFLMSIHPVAALLSYLAVVMAGLMDSYIDFRKVKAHTLG